MHYSQSFLSLIPRDTHSDMPLAENSRFFGSQHNSIARSALRDKANAQHWEPNKLLDIFAKDIRAPKRSEVTTRILQRIFNMRGSISQSTIIGQKDNKPLDHPNDACPLVHGSVPRSSYLSHVIQNDFKGVGDGQEECRLEELKHTLCQQDDFNLRGLLHYINARQNTRFHQVDELIRLFEPTCMTLDSLPDKIITKDDVIETFTPNTPEHLNLVFGRSKALDDAPFSAKTRNLVCEILALRYKN
jgi:hypothetical protein